MLCEFVMRVPLQLCLCLFAFSAAVSEMQLPVLRRPECAKTLEANIMGTRYDVNANGVNIDNNWRRNLVDLDNDEENFDKMLRRLPNETFQTIVSAF